MDSNMYFLYEYSLLKIEKVKFLFCVKYCFGFLLIQQLCSKCHRAIWYFLWFVRISPFLKKIFHVDIRTVKTPLTLGKLVQSNRQFPHRSQVIRWCYYIFRSCLSVFPAPVFIFYVSRFMLITNLNRLIVASDSGCNFNHILPCVSETRPTLHETSTSM